MSTEDWIAIAGVVPLGIIGGWIQAFRIWRRQADVSSGVTWITGNASAAGVHSFLLPGVAGITALWLGVVHNLVFQGEPTVRASADSMSSWLMGIGVLLIFLAFWMWLFAWPRFLVPPHLRGEPGWLPAAWGNWRQDRDKPGESVMPRRTGGERARK